MSSRVLKKLSVKIQEPNQLDAEEIESDCDLVIPTKKQLNINRYDLVRYSFFLSGKFWLQNYRFLCVTSHVVYCQLCVCEGCYEICFCLHVDDYCCIYVFTVSFYKEIELNDLNCLKFWLQLPIYHENTLFKNILLWTKKTNQLWCLSHSVFLLVKKTN